jgi:hypothetical protein
VLLQACYFAGPFVYYEEPIVVELKKSKFLILTHDWRCNLAPYLLVIVIFDDDNTFRTGCEAMFQRMRSINAKGG